MLQAVLSKNGDALRRGPMVEHLVGSYRVSERRACRVLCVTASHIAGVAQYLRFFFSVSYAVDGNRNLCGQRIGFVQGFAQLVQTQNVWVYQCLLNPIQTIPREQFRCSRRSASAVPQVAARVLVRP